MTSRVAARSLAAVIVLVAVALAASPVWAGTLQLPVPELETLGNGLKVAWVQASTIPAEMIDLMAFRDRAVLKLVGCAMTVQHSPSIANRSRVPVARKLSSRPTIPFIRREVRESQEFGDQEPPRWA